MAENFESQLSLSTRSINNRWKSKCIELLEELEKNMNSTAINKNSSDLLKTKLQSESSLSDIQGEITSLQRQLKELDIETQDKPDKRSELALYQLITKLRWDLESPKNHIKGFVAQKPFKVFDIDVTKHSEQEIVDKLWALIDPKE